MTIKGLSLNKACSNEPIVSISRFVFAITISAFKTTTSTTTATSTSTSTTSTTPTTSSTSTLTSSVAPYTQLSGSCTGGFAKFVPGSSIALSSLTDVWIYFGKVGTVPPLLGKVSAPYSMFLTSNNTVRYNLPSPLGLVC